VFIAVIAGTKGSFVQWEFCLRAASVSENLARKVDEKQDGGPPKTTAGPIAPLFGTTC
jgi:hypothetical protein